MPEYVDKQETTSRGPLGGVCEHVLIAYTRVRMCVAVCVFMFISVFVFMFISHVCACVYLW